MEQLDNLTKKKLDQILTREPQALSQSDIDFLNARIGYLTDEQVALYKPVLSKKTEPAPQPRLNRSRNYKAMQKELASLGHKVVGVPREQLEKMLDTIHGPQN